MTISTVSVFMGMACILSGCICAGECGGSPNDLKVTFKAEVSRTAANSVLNRCGADPIVDEIGGLHVKNGRLTSTLRVKKRPGEPATQSLMRCLLAAPQVSGIGREM